MSSRKIWLLTLAALCFSGLLMCADLISGSRGLFYNTDTHTMNTGWKISGGTKTLYEAASFAKAGSLKNEHLAVLTKTLPATVDQSVCFVTIGYRVAAFVNDQDIYTFNPPLDSKEVRGVKTHILKIPDGTDGREFRLVLATNQPGNTAVSKYIILDNAIEIIRALQKSDLMKSAFALLYIFIGISILIFTLISAILKKFDLSLLMLALIALFIGTGILLNLSSIAFYTGPEAVYWMVNIINLALPIPALLFVAADRGYAQSRLLTAMAVVQSVFLAIWLVCNFLNIDIIFLHWQPALFAAILAGLIITFVKEFKSGSGRPEIAVSVIAILLTSVINAHSYFTAGRYETMDFSLIITALPVLVLMTGKVVLSSAQKEYRILNENMTLRLEGELLYKNYNKTEKYIEETKRIWHDIDRHFSVISNLAGNGVYEELKLYLKQVGYDFKKIKETYLCENKLINAILTEKISEAEDSGIEVRFTGNLPDKLKIQGNDLCSLLVNMLDNAIEACIKIPEGHKKKIDISIRMKNGFIYFGVLNTSPVAPVMAGEDFITSKADKTKHGYGISIIQRITRKYNGAFDIILSNNSFLVKAALKNADAGEFFAKDYNDNL
ncbi:signal transduction histidine kinase regulating citrate/malate metabolism [Desulfofarcimen acetoxidans DSM 771]|uniref:Signal transduction histidine kinase regulating citrate/malate metabolism n=1 Tax=Desulfofarcimen acetoxidans (strain ATCC 49208 / DSM 771 / KCTC 5769 / VKM B-1644 / 5575) TaxID=485916 RepID=C8W0A2_DESAS|nr:sensor histidine kinase [Desulfofarcimen acetoxidans]ACV63157.1 signal transduction histidine kinase regulating citrate/malate metabolism [Desulfofarcimen acetoxidans DSM 771]